MRFYRPLIAMCIGLLIAGVAAAAPTPQTGTCTEPVTISAKDSVALRDAFNRARGSVRLVFLVDPICSGCLRGLKDLDTAVLTPFAGNSKLQTYVIHTPVLGAQEKDSANTCSLIHNEHVTHYWDPGQELGTTFAQALGMKDGDRTIYAWDVWLVYGPQAEWTGEAPPKADFMMHQLKDLMGRAEFPFLRASTFREEVEKRLDVHKATDAASAR
ncbi:hypothetical protein DFR29_1248 [Tahibacter aquaticus]|uniref:Thioredoxin-like protein n=1 Tax=Tahibacter aquaticus TaxID=520092 RepID=A0A4R6YKP7_9GAMM|nr:hypothetical protein [Tahibacter aquaticus]TDR37711.1 hypothetical protein DFR29_1248 [Tahibacter aquaticus]